MRRFQLLPGLAAVVLAALVPSSVLADDAPAPGEVHIEELSYAGSGCPEDSTSILLTPNGQALTVLFDDFIAEDGPGVPSARRRRDCHIVAELAYPDGWQYTIFRVNYRGGALLDEETWGRQQARLHILGAGAMPSHMRINGPFVEDYRIESEIAPNARAWSQCHGPGTLTIDASIHAHARHQHTAVMTVYSIDSVVEQTYEIEWRRCP